MDARAKTASKAKTKSSTKTKVKKKKKFNRISGGDGISYSRAYKYNKVVSKFLKKATDANSRYQRSTDITTRVSSTIGRQSVTDIAYLVNVTDLGNYFTQGSITPTGDWFVSQCSVFAEFHNQANSCAKIWIYDLICKVDDASTPSAAWNNGLSTDQGGTASAYLFPYSMPNASKEFKTMWQIHKVHLIELDAGASHIHNFKYGYNRKISQDRYQNTSTFIKGTYACMIVTLGSLNNDQTTKTQISYGQTAVNVYVRTKHDFGYVTGSKLNTTITSGLPTAFTVTGSTMLEDSDLVAAEVAA